MPHRLLSHSSHTRRDFLKISASAGLGFTLLGCGSTTSRPSLYWTTSDAPGLRSVADLRHAVRKGRAERMYAQILALIESDFRTETLTPSSPLPGRSEGSITSNNPDFIVTDAAAQRILRAAFVTVMTDDPVYKQIALDQLTTLFDEELWEGWISKAHLRFGVPVGLRTGQLAEATGLAYDWLYDYLTDAERVFIVEGLDRRAITPFFETLKLDVWWLHDLNNWLTTIIGGLGIAGMALKNDHDRSEELVAYARERMTEYLSIYGPKGEFNESAAYANATLRPVSFFEGLRYVTAGETNRLAQYPFPETCKWQLYLTLPPGRVAAFGDAKTDRAPWVSHIAAVASATQDPVLQDFFIRNAPDDPNPIDLLWFNSELDGESPKDSYPLGAAFPAHGGYLVSRSSWADQDPICIVYGKASREENHGHNDVGQVCIDGNGERLVVDLGSPSEYPEDFFDDGRYEYYNASVRGHNILMFDHQEMLFPKRERGKDVGDELERVNGRLVEFEFDDQRGGYWIVDTTDAYADIHQVRRVVVHLLPGIVAVVDEATGYDTMPISLRWHTIDPVVPDENGRFSLVTELSRLSGRLVSLAGDVSFESKRHAYRAPYDRGRTGGLLEQRHEPYIEMLAESDGCRFLSLFAVARWDDHIGEWSGSGSFYEIDTDLGLYTVEIEDQHLLVGRSGEPIWEVNLV